MMRESDQKIPLAYFITFPTYGTWLHGDPRGSVDHRHRAFEAPRIKSNNNLRAYMQKEQRYPVITLNEYQRSTVMNAIQCACEYYHWRLYAIHVRSNHVHLVVTAPLRLEKVMNQLKAYASRALNKLAIQPLAQRKYWTTHGSTRYIWSQEFLLPVMHYVIDQQGSRMACYYESWYDE